MGGKSINTHNKPIFTVMYGGSGGIRTHGTVPRTLVFKTRALNHSATLPYRDSAFGCGYTPRGDWLATRCNHIYLAPSSVAGRAGLAHVEIGRVMWGWTVALDTVGARLAASLWRT